MSKVYFVGFFTEGPPHDGGYDLRPTADRVVVELLPHFSDTFLFSKRRLKRLPGSESVCNEFDAPLPMNPNANKIGYFDFKPFLLKHVMSIVQDDSIIVYSDMNFDKYNYWSTDWTRIKDMARILLDGGDIFVSTHYDNGSTVPLSYHVRPSTVRHMFHDAKEFQSVRQANLLQASQIIVRNTEFGRRFASDYHSLCQDKELISPTLNEFDRIYDEPMWTCGDQDVLNCLLYRYMFDGKLKSDFPRYVVPNRIMKMPFKTIDQFADRKDLGYSAAHDRQAAIENARK